MPLLTITLKGSELIGKHMVLLERMYKFTSLKLLHVYHNIDSVNFLLDDDSKQQASLFLKLGGLVDSGAHIINYVGSWETPAASSTVRVHGDTDEQFGGGTLKINLASSTTDPGGNNRYGGDVDISHLIPVGASKHNTAEIISRDLHKVLHKNGVLNFNGELEFSLHYLNTSGTLTEMSSLTGGILAQAKSMPATFFTMVFDFEEEV